MYSECKFLSFRLPISLSLFLPQGVLSFSRLTNYGKSYYTFKVYLYILEFFWCFEYFEPIMNLHVVFIFQARPCVACISLAQKFYNTKYILWNEKNVHLQKSNISPVPISFQIEGSPHAILMCTFWHPWNSFWHIVF